MRAKPRPQQGPKAFHGVHVYFMKAIAVIIPRLFATAVTDACMRIAPRFQAAINVILIRVNTGPWRNRRFAQGFDRPLLDVLDRKSTRLNSSHSQISYAVFCLKKKKIIYPFASI